jgi:hypothetical protein
MDEHAVTLFVIEQQIKKMPEDIQWKIKECEAQLRTVIFEYGDVGRIALALIGAQLAAGESD